MLTGTSEFNSGVLGSFCSRFQVQAPSWNLCSLSSLCLLFSIFKSLLVTCLWQRTRWIRPRLSFTLCNHRFAERGQGCSTTLCFQDCKKLQQILPCVVLLSWIRKKISVFKISTERAQNNSKTVSFPIMKKINTFILTYFSIMMKINWFILMYNFGMTDRNILTSDRLARWPFLADLCVSSFQGGSSAASDSQSETNGKMSSFHPWPFRTYPGGCFLARWKIPRKRFRRYNTSTLGSIFTASTW